MKRNIFISLEEEVFIGDILDICCEGSEGIIYNVYKTYDDECAIDYVSKKGKKIIKSQRYDTCFMFFSLSSIWFKINKSKFLNEISSMLKKDGVLYIWDMDKSYKNTFKGSIKVLLPGKKIKQFTIKDNNIFKDNSKECITSIVRKHFEIVDLKASDGIYYIKARKRAA